MPHRGKRVLILDDEPFTVQALADRLRYEELAVEVTDSAAACLQLAKEKRFDLFILDIALGSYDPEPLRDGIAVARALREDEATVNVPIVGITAIMPQRREEALESGMVNFFEKPFEPDDVVPSLLALLESRSQAQEAMAKWLVQTAGPGWSNLELIVTGSAARLRSSLVAGEGPLSLQRRDLNLALRMVHLGQLDQELFEEIGDRLYQGLFPSQINVGLQQCRLLSQLAKQRVRVLLRLDDGGWESLPWELSRYTGGTDGGHWLGGDPCLTCSRVASNAGPLREDEPLARPLRILVVGASPAGSPLLDLDGELQDLHKALRPLAARPGGSAGVEWRVLGPAGLGGAATELAPAAEASPANVIAALDSFHPHVVHFMAHGRRGSVLLEEDGFLSEWSDFFFQLDLARKGVRLLVLNCCLSGHPGAGSPGPSLAALTAGVTAVVGHFFQVTDHAARRFARLLYEGLARGELIDVAVHTARSRVWSEELKENRPFLPLLFVRDRFLRFDCEGAA